jgi:phosphate starvation-inducible membrane PsiE
MPAKITQSRLVKAFRESTNVFLDSALIFAVSMLGAAIVRYARVLIHPEEDVSYYSLLGSVYMAAFSIFPALVLQSVTDGLHGKILRQALWLILIATAIAVEVMCVGKHLALPPSLSSPR